MLNQTREENRNLQDLSEEQANQIANAESIFEVRTQGLKDDFKEELDSK